VPPPYEASTPAPVRPKPSFVEVGLSLGGESPRPAPALGGDGSMRESFGGVALSIAGGKEFAPYASVFGYAEIGGESAPRYTSGATSWSVGLADLTVAPGIRLHTRSSRVRFFAGLAAGLDVRWVGASANGSTHVSGSGTGFAIVTDGGLEVRMPSLYVSAAMVLLLHDVGSVRDASGAALFADSGAARLGLRVMLGYPF
jgi:hypothetical protein